MRFLATKIREGRRGRFTAKELADKAGVSTGLVSEIERGIGNPSLTSLAKLAAALDLPLIALLDASDDRRVVIIRRDERRTLGEPNSDQSVELLTPIHRRFVVTRSRIAPGVSSAPDRDYNADLFFHVLVGRVTVDIGGVRHELGLGDSIYFDARVGFVLANPYRSVAEVLSCAGPAEF
jgi:transcriptional regulator with XRE-family HTH domain